MNRTIYNIFAFAHVRDICFLKILTLQSLVLLTSTVVVHDCLPISLYRENT